MTTPDIDARPANDEIDQIAQLRSDYDDAIKTIMSRLGRPRVGKIEYTPLPVPEAGAVFLQGQTLQKADQPVLWQWIVDNSPAGFSTTPTTLTLPDYRGRSVVGAGTGAGATYALGETGGSATRALGVANLPSHDHGGSTAASSHSHTGTTSADSHNHSGSTGADVFSHQHGTHFHDVVGGVSFNPGGGSAPSNPNPGNTGNATTGHTHNFTTSSDAHSHTFSTSANAHAHDIPAQGSGTAFDNRPPYIALNYQIWT